MTAEEFAMQERFLKQIDEDYEPSSPMPKYDGAPPEPLPKDGQ
jgi:hypothetical protein